MGKTAAEVDIHSFGSRFDSFMASLDERCGFVNVDYVRRFADYCFSLGLSAPRVYKYASTIAKISRIMRKDFMEVTRDDVERFVAGVERNKRLSPWAKQNYKVALKFFFKWLKGNGGEKYPPEVEWINTTLKSKDVQLPI